MSSIVPTMRHVRGFDIVRPLSVGLLMFMMLPLVFLPLASIFIFGTSNGLDKFWAALMQPEAVFALKLSMATSFWATAFNVIFGLFAAYVLSRYNFWGRNALIVTISLPTAIPTAVAGFALLLLWGPYGTLGRFLAPQGIQVMFTAGAIILANIFVTFPLAFGVIKPVFDTMSRSLEEAFNGRQVTPAGRGHSLHQAADRLARLGKSQGRGGNRGSSDLRSGGYSSDGGYRPRARSQGRRGRTRFSRRNGSAR